MSSTGWLYIVNVMIVMIAVRASSGTHTSGSFRVVVTAIDCQEEEDVGCFIVATVAGVVVLVWFYLSDLCLLTCDQLRL